jgi:hypothetical protein
MKKFFYSFAFCLFLFIHHSQAQVKFGIQAGAGFSKLTSPYTIFEMGLGYSGGVTAILPFKNKLSFVSGLQYQALQNKLSGIVLLDNGTFDQGNGTVTVQYNYLTLPVLARLGIGQEENPKFYVDGGGYVSYVLGVNTSGKKKDGSNFSYQENTSSLNKIIAGVSVGAGYYITNNISIGAKYNYDIIPVAEGSSRFVNGQVLLSYWF